MKEQLVYVDRQNTGSVKWDGMKEKYGRDDLPYFYRFFISHFSIFVFISVKSACLSY